MSESVCSLKFAQRVRSVELNSSSSSTRRHENSSTSSSPTHDSVELDSPPVTPVPLPISRASSVGSTLSSASRTPSSSRRRSQSQLSTGKKECTHTHTVIMPLPGFCHNLCVPHFLNYNSSSHSHFCKFNKTLNQFLISSSIILFY
ncbi:kinesin KIFC3 isoform X1 [Solea senegalensis]|uniref:Kinesin KIFC3 isoform X1 n=1 Tax=Solea senegalensis TaxID=28829 RepID=A0AAV6PFZ6_SOLSE|nr:kinesin KIFC3 isoform X1 [Solea senegalensis]